MFYNKKIKTVYATICINAAKCKLKGVKELKILSDEEIQFLISCPKKITSPPKQKNILSQGHYRNGMELYSEDGEHRFTVFMRVSEAFEENFSIGLRYHPSDDPERIILLRCNGPHGEHRNSLDGRNSHYWTYHIHFAKEIIIKKGLRSESFAEETNDYSNYSDALAFFLQYCNIKNHAKYFRHIAQPSLFDL